MRISSCHFSLLGSRGENQDALLPLTKVGNSYWAAIADGMGGSKGGRIAAQCAIETVKNCILDGPNRSMESIFSRVKETLSNLAKDDSILEHMGTTLSLVHCIDSTVYVGHVGDSRVYQIRGHGILTRTIDQTEVQKLLDEKIISKSQAKRYNRRNVLLSVMAPNETYELFNASFRVEANDRVLLSTDGLHSAILRREISELSASIENVCSFCKALQKEAEIREPSDNFSAIALEFVEC